MNDLAALGSISLEAVEDFMLQQPQVACPLTHHFGPGVYIREVLMPQGALVIGHSHKRACMNILVSGSMKIVEDGITRVITAPLIFTSPPGRKLALMLTDVVFQNVWATDETDVEKLEDLLVDKSAKWEAKHQIETDALLRLST